MIKYTVIDLFLKSPIKYLIDKMSEDVIAIFMLHRFDYKEYNTNGITSDALHNFLFRLKKMGYSFIDINEFIHLSTNPNSKPGRKALFIIDDGYIDQLEVGVPIFKSHKCPVTIAIVTDFISNKLWPWDAKLRYLFEETSNHYIDYKRTTGEINHYSLKDNDMKLSAMRSIRSDFKKLSHQELLASLDHLSRQLDINIPIDAPARYRAFTWDDVKRYEGNGVNFIPHSKSHFILSKLTPEQAKYEIEQSIYDINQHIKSIPAFVYPNGEIGDYSADDVKTLKENNIKVAFSTTYGYVHAYSYNSLSLDPFNLPRIPAPHDSCLQLKISSNIDCLEEKFLSNSFKSLFEIIYGSKRQALNILFENIFNIHYKFLYRNIDFKRVKRVIFICKGNICRSPFAEAVASKMTDRLPVKSMGYEASGGDQPEKSSIQVAKEFGYNLEHLRSTKFDKSLLRDNDLLVVMEPSHIKVVKNHLKGSNCQITLLGLWCNKPIISIKDPYGRSDARFKMIFSYINEGVKNLVTYIN